MTDAMNLHNFPSRDDSGESTGVVPASRPGLVPRHEPIGQIIGRPDTAGNQQEIPNEDALSLVFDDTILFDLDKFSGYDRIETGTRANVGGRYTAQFASGAYGRAVFGQSYQIAGDNEFDTDFYRTAGLATDQSDYVGGLYVQASSYLGFSAQSRFDVLLQRISHRQVLSGHLYLHHQIASGPPTIWRCLLLLLQSRIV